MDDDAPVRGATLTGETAPRASTPSTAAEPTSASSSPGALSSPAAQNRAGGTRTERVSSAMTALFTDAVSGAASSLRRRARRRAGRRRVGVVDIGSNSVRLVVYDGAPRAPDVYFNEKSLCGLGADLARRGELNAEGRARALAALSRFRGLLDGMDVDAIQVVATAAVRDARDGPDFAAAVSRLFGAGVWVATGEDEATLAAQGVLFGAPDAAGVVADMGGGSMEIAGLLSAEDARFLGRGDSADARVGARVTTPLGPLRLAGMSAPSRATEIERALAEALRSDAAREAFVDQPTLYALGGSWRAMARAHMRRSDYALKVLHGFELPLDEALDAADWVAGLSISEMRARAGVSERRAAVTPLAAAALAGLLRAARPEKLVLSAFGLREGVLWRAMSAAERAEDPLLAAVGEIEAAQARAPGYGEALWRWLRPIFSGRLSPSEARLAQAFCRLADAAWRTHPDYRAQASFELATRANFGGASHRDRLFIATALLHRHKGGKAAARREAALDLLPSGARRTASALGRAARLGDAVAAGAPRGLKGARLAVDGDRLALTLDGRAAGLNGEAVERRLDATAQALQLSPELRVR